MDTIIIVQTDEDEFCIQLQEIYHQEYKTNSEFFIKKDQIPNLIELLKKIEERED